MIPKVHRKGGVNVREDGEEVVFKCADGTFGIIGPMIAGGL